MINIVKKPDQKEVTTILGKDVHKIIEKYSDVKKYRLYREEWRRASTLQYIPKYPLQIDFELNYSCNFSCEMCTWSAENTAGRGKKTWFSFEAYQEIIDEGIKNGLKAIRLNYINEPLIRKDIIKFIEYAKKVGILDIYLSTNGSLLTEKIIRELIKSGLTRLQVSIDATTKETFDKIRQGGNFDAVIKNTLNFIKIRNDLNVELPTLRVNFVKTDLNQHEYSDFIKTWSDKADCIGIQDLVNIMKPSKEQITKKKFTCAQPFYHLTVRYDGSVLPCCTFFAGDLRIGNIYENSVEELWKSEPMRALRKTHLEGKYFENPVCRACAKSSIAKDMATGIEST
jgi:radical SAM protein with 4Fe4S-binding SPASM domain